MFSISLIDSFETGSYTENLRFTTDHEHPSFYESSISRD
ncbi:hypothetical protein LEP1GSC163_3808 [Leptospira santarosai str. CBC379]|uniref:Uncharacterized protein n=1 Tax=Leptospira santarosai str. MOR084 TaxID=1049984 RepID=A0A0E2BI12_9LEPT|nr:hypothetical protein LEP1GSC179_3434 [Leptospira santarosai str. MOR084]EKR91298.1 hypothetical protein LEP1GSC163_3808 [Leptospira santarosai str. CBC379]